LIFRVELLFSDVYIRFLSLVIDSYQFLLFSDGDFKSLEGCLCGVLQAYVRLEILVECLFEFGELFDDFGSNS